MRTQKKRTDMDFQKHLKQQTLITLITSILLCIILQTPTYAWNPDYAYRYRVPEQRRMCAYRDTPDTVRFYSIDHDQSCPPGQYRYVVVFGREPYGSMALLRTKTSQEYYPPLKLEWPVDPDLSNNHLWHFTCVSERSQEILGSKISLLKYHGEITSPGKEPCESMEARALEYCQKHYHGDFLLESCLLSW